MRELFLKLLDEGAQTVTLLCSSCVFGNLVVGCHSPNVADTDADGVMTLTMCTDSSEWSAHMDAAITIDNKVIADAIPSLCTMPSINVIDGVVLPIRGCTAVDDDFFDLTHVFIYWI